MAEDNRANEPDETPEDQIAETEAQLDPEQRIVDEPVAESQDLAAEETSIVSRPEAEATDEVDDDDEEPTPRVKPLIPGADLEVDIVREGEDALRSDDPYAQYDEETGELIETDAE